MSAPATVFRGYATVEGAAGSIGSAVIVTGVTGVSQSVKASQNFDEEAIKDVHGYDVAWLFRNEHETVDITLHWLADTAAHAAAPVQANSTVATLSALGYPFFAPGSTLTLAGFTLTALNGVFQVMPGWDVDLSNTQAAKYSLKLRKYANDSQQTQIAVIPT